MCWLEMILSRCVPFACLIIRHLEFSHYYSVLQWHISRFSTVLKQCYAALKSIMSALTELESLLMILHQGHNDVTKYRDVSK